MRRILLAAAAFLASVAAIGGVIGVQTDFKASLSGSEEVPAVSTSGHGSFAAKLAGDELAYELRYTWLEGAPLFAHIHLGGSGTNGGVIAFLCGGGGKPACPAPPGMVSGTIVPADVVGPASQGIDPGEFAELVRELKSNLTYVNVHTDRFPSGEIRGQIAKRFTRNYPTR